MTDDITSGLRGRTVAVTGASGFIGGRLVETLLRSADVDVIAVARSARRAAELAAAGRPRLWPAVADLGSDDGSSWPLDHADVLVHCAFGNSGDVAQRWRATVDGTAAALRLARHLGAGRFVHISSMSVYDPGCTDVLTEDSPGRVPAAGDTEYAAQKVRAEELVSANAEGLEFVILQPTIVYGPRSDLWTVRPLARMATESHLLPTRGGGVCNAVFVDDVVSAIQLAATVPDASGERFLVSGPRPITWGEFFDAYRAIAPSLSKEGETPGALSEWERQAYADCTVVDCGRAKRLLGYQPAFDFTCGISATRPWAVQAGLAR